MSLGESRFIRRQRIAYLGRGSWHIRGIHPPGQHRVL